MVSIAPNNQIWVVTIASVSLDLILNFNLISFFQYLLFETLNNLDVYHRTGPLH